jgi:quinol monooxygenase YgiN
MGRAQSRLDSKRVPRRQFLTVAGTVAATLAVGAWAVADSGGEMYGQIAKITAIPSKRDELIAVLLEGTKSMPGCLSYIIAKDVTEADAIWISEAWENKESHDASLSLASVKYSLSKGRALIAGFSNRVVTTPIGGTGLGRSKGSLKIGLGP